MDVDEIARLLGFFGCETIMFFLLRDCLGLKVMGSVLKYNLKCKLCLVIKSCFVYMDVDV